MLSARRSFAVCPSRRVKYLRHNHQTARSQQTTLLRSHAKQGSRQTVDADAPAAVGRACIAEGGDAPAKPTMAGAHSKVSPVHSKLQHRQIGESHRARPWAVVPAEPTSGVPSRAPLRRHPLHRCSIRRHCTHELQLAQSPTSSRPLAMTNDLTHRTGELYCTVLLDVNGSARIKQGTFFRICEVLPRGSVDQQCY